jgi:hypothetical protein
VISARENVTDMGLVLLGGMVCDCGLSIRDEFCWGGRYLLMRSGDLRGGGWRCPEGPAASIGALY